ncbi:MAG: hypothetical protein AB8G77_01720 [Rhodothermales bacterium]
MKKADSKAPKDRFLNVKIKSQQFHKGASQLNIGRKQFGTNKQNS